MFCMSLTCFVSGCRDLGMSYLLRCSLFSNQLLHSSDMQTQKENPEFPALFLINTKPFKSRWLMTSWAASHSPQTLWEESSSGNRAHQQSTRDRSWHPNGTCWPGHGKALWVVMAGLSPSWCLAQVLVELCGKPKLGSSFQAAWKSSRQRGLAVWVMPLMPVAYKMGNLHGLMLVRW